MQRKNFSSSPENDENSSSCSAAGPRRCARDREAAAAHAHAQARGKDIHLISSKELIEHISETSFDPQFGARPLKRMIQKELLNELSRQIIAGTVETGQPQVVDVFDGKIVFRKPIGEEERNGSNGKAKKAREKA